MGAKWRFIVCSAENQGGRSTAHLLDLKGCADSFICSTCYSEGGTDSWLESMVNRRGICQGRLFSKLLSVKVICAGFWSSALSETIPSLSVRRPQHWMGAKTALSSFTLYRVISEVVMTTVQVVF